MDVSGMLALPYIVMRNDHQDALGTGLAVTEHAPAGKSAEEVRALWQWVEKKLTAGALAHERLGSGEFQVAARPVLRLPTSALTAAIAPE